jgi:hypothetical protein
MIVSAGARESIQVSSTAAGYCPLALALCWARKSRVSRRPFRNRSFPFRISARICSGVIASRLAFVSASAAVAVLSVPAPIIAQAAAEPDNFR